MRHVSPRTRGLLHKLGVDGVVIFCAAALGISLAWAASTASTATNVSCATATATLPGHTVGVDGTAVDTISGTSTAASHCNTVTYTIPTSTVTTTVTPTSPSTTQSTSTPTSTSTTSSQTTTSSSSTAAPTGATVPAAPLGPATPTGGWSVEYADAFGSCLTDTATECTAGFARADDTLTAMSSAHGDGNSNEIASFVPAEVNVTSAGLELRCDAKATSTDHYSCGALKGASPAVPFGWHTGTGYHFVMQFAGQIPPDEGNMDPGVWSTGSNYTWENDFPEWWGWQHYVSSGNTWCGNGWTFPGVPQDQGGATGQTEGTWCSSPGLNFDPSASLHTYTLDMSGDSMTGYIDGVKVTSNSFSSFNSAIGKLILQNDLRLNNATKANPDPHFPAAGNSFVIRYVAFYEPTSASHYGSTGPTIVPGTTVK